MPAIRSDPPGLNLTREALAMLGLESSMPPGAYSPQDQAIASNPPSIRVSYSEISATADFGLIGDGSFDNSPRLIAGHATVPDDGRVYKLRYPAGKFMFNQAHDVPNLLFEGNGIDTTLQANAVIDHLFNFRSPAGSVNTYHGQGLRSLRVEGASKTTSYLAQLGYYGGADPSPLDFVSERVWYNGSPGDGLRIYSGKGIISWSFFEGITFTGLGLDYSYKQNGIFQGVSGISPAWVQDCYWQGCGQDLAAYASQVFLRGNRYGDGQGNPWNMFFDQCTVVDMDDCIWHNPMLGGNNLYPLILVLDSTAGTLTKDRTLAYRIHDCILNGFVNKPTYFMSVDTPGGGYQPVPKYIRDISGPSMGTAFVNTPANFELIENVPPPLDNLAGFGVTTAGVPASTTSYTNNTGHRLIVTFLTVNAATYTITDLNGTVGPAMTAVAGGICELLPGEIITPTYTTLTWKFYAK